MFSVRRLLAKNLDLLVCITLMIAAVPATLNSTGLLRAGLAFISAFFLPGYTFLHAIFRRPVEGLLIRIMLTIGLSIALNILGGILLNLTPWGLQTATWLMFISMVTLCSSVIALVQRVGSDLSGEGLRIRFPEPIAVLITTLSVALTVVALLIARNGALAQHSAYTKMWIQRQDDAFRINIQSQESSVVRFNLEVKIGDTLIQEWTDIQLLPGDLWTSDIKPSRTLKVIIDSVDHPYLSATLYRLDAPNTVYRYVMLHLDNESQP